MSKDTCFVCSSAQQLTEDHIIPRSEGGGDNSHNLLILCRTCHNYVEQDEDRPRTKSGIRAYGLMRFENDPLAVEKAQRKCGSCDVSFFYTQAHQRYCTRRCKELATQSRRKSKNLRTPPLKEGSPLDDASSISILLGKQSEKPVLVPSSNCRCGKWQCTCKCLRKERPEVKHSSRKHPIPKLTRGGRRDSKDTCFVCGCHFAAKELRWCAAIAYPDKSCLHLGWKWETVCGADFWDEPPRGRRAGVRKSIEGEAR